MFDRWRVGTAQRRAGFEQRDGSVPGARVATGRAGAARASLGGCEIPDGQRLMSCGACRCRVVPCPFFISLGFLELLRIRGEEGNGLICGE